nr:replication protein A 70 kDa DNA-binding subunit B-like [Ipomoea batatas]
MIEAREGSGQNPLQLTTSISISLGESLLLESSCWKMGKRTMRTSLMASWWPDLGGMKCRPGGNYALAVKGVPHHLGKRVGYGVGAFSYLPMLSGIHLIGRVVSIHQPKDIQVKQNSQRLIDFVIEDCRESRLAVTLWDEHVDSVLPYFNDGEIRISSSYSATRVLFNYECPEVFAFKDRFLTPIRTISSRSRNTGSGSLETMSNENITMTSLMDIYDDKKVGEFWVVGEITDIQPDWYFIACANKGCGKKIQEINEQMYCKSCDIQSPDEIIKYKLVIDVLDDEQDGQLILWGNVCSPLLGFTASELKGKYSEEGCMPNEIGGLIGKTMKFMIVTREDQFKYKGNAAFTVLRVQSNEAKSNSFKKGKQGNVIRKLAEEKEFNENFGQVCTI